MPVTANLVQSVRTSARRAFDIAAREVVQDIRQHPDTPIDTGDLRKGIESRGRVVTGLVYKIDIKSTTKNAGFDYPEFLHERAGRISPTRAKYLRFQVGGQTVFSKGFDNIHTGWWDKVLQKDRDETIWTEALKKAYERTSR